MTDQRFSLARLTAGGMLVLAAFGASAQDMPRSANPFQRPPATSTGLTFPAVLDRPASTQEPLTLPPPLPVPADSTLPVLKLPSRTAAPIPVLPPPTPAARESDDAASGAKSSLPKPRAAPAEPERPRAFMSREKIEANRARCQVGMNGKTLVQLPAGDAEQIVHLTGANGCLTAMSAQADWLDVRYAGNNELVVSVQANPDAASRRSEVTVVAPNQTFVLTVRQAGAEPVKPVPAPVPVAAPVPAKTALPASPETSVRGLVEAKPAEAKPAEAKPAQAKLAEAATAAKPLELAAPTKAAEPAAKVGEPVAVSPVTTSPVTLATVSGKEAGTPAPATAAAVPEYDAARARLSDNEEPSVSQVRSVLKLSSPPDAVAFVAATDLLPLPAMTFALPDVAMEVFSLKALAARENSVPVMRASELERLAMPKLSLPNVAAPVVPQPVEPAEPAVDPVRAQSVLRAFLPPATPQTALPATAPAKAPSAKTAPHPAKAAPNKAVSVPDGYVTLDEYEAAAPAKKAGR